MVVFKCKMCGGDINAENGATYGACDSCGVTSTLPKALDEKVVNLFNRANHLRRINEFDKALDAYESILNEDASNAEAHWGASLSRYGIEYVEDPRTHERVPTCHRMQYVSILSDADYKAALENAADGYSRELFAKEAEKINELQKRILLISNREKPFDVFICYKETSDGGSRTKDSTIAQDIYYHLTNEGFRVFFAKITLEDKLGQEYEPFIFAALNSAKVMLVIGTRKEYFESVWVKNEWSRFLELTKTDHSRLLVPCYSEMDAYDIPNELAMLQCQDLSKIGALQDIIRGIKKIVNITNVDNVQTPSIAPISQTDNKSISIENERLLKRGNIYLEDKHWKKAYSCFAQVLGVEEEWDDVTESNLPDFDNKNAPAYIGLMCARWEMTPDYLDKEIMKYEAFLSPLDRKDFRGVFRYLNMVAGYRLLESEEFENADERFDVVLDTDPEYAQAYVGKLLAELKLDISTLGILILNEDHAKSIFITLADEGKPFFSESMNYKRIIRYGDEMIRGTWETLNKSYIMILEQEAQLKRERMEKEEQIERERRAEVERKEEECRQLEAEKKEKEQREAQEKKARLEQEEKESKRKRPFQISIIVIEVCVLAIWLWKLYSMPISWFNQYENISISISIFLPYTIVSMIASVLLRLFKYTDDQISEWTGGLFSLYFITAIVVAVIRGLFKGIRGIFGGFILFLFVGFIAAVISIIPTMFIGKENKAK